MTSTEVMPVKLEAHDAAPASAPPTSVAPTSARTSEDGFRTEDATMDSEDHTPKNEDTIDAPAEAAGIILLPMHGSEFRRNNNGDVLCHVEGCDTIMAEETAYFRRYKICRMHLKSNHLIVENRKQRFCQQCGKFHGVEKFDGPKRNCRDTLVRHNKRRKKTSRAKRKKSSSDDSDSEMRQHKLAPTQTHGAHANGTHANGTHANGTHTSGPSLNLETLKAYYRVPNSRETFSPDMVNTMSELERSIGREVICYILQSAQKQPPLWHANGHNPLAGNIQHYAKMHQSYPMMNAFHQYGSTMPGPFTSGMPAGTNHMVPPPPRRGNEPRTAFDSVADQAAGDILMDMKNQATLPPLSQCMRMPQ